MYSNEISKYCINKLDLNNAILSNEYYYSNLPLCIIDAVFSISIKYTTTQNVVQRFSSYINIDKFRQYGSSFPRIDKQYSINQFIDFYEENNIDFITNNVYKNKCRTSTVNGILKSKAVLEFAKVLQKHEINYFQDLTKVVNNANFERDIKHIKGQGSGISLSYFFMLAGDENLIQPDRMVERFVEDCIGKKLSTNELTQLFLKVIKILKDTYPNLTLRELDHEIWKLKSNS
jgi:hypothetical protein